MSVIVTDKTNVKRDLKYFVGIYKDEDYAVRQGYCPNDGSTLQIMGESNGGQRGYCPKGDFTTERI